MAFVDFGALLRLSWAISFSYIAKIIIQLDNFKVY
jgi:hypothetical protein